MVKNKVVVIGLGYIGLPTSLVLSSSEQKVIGVDINESLVKVLNSNKVTFEEPGLIDLYDNARKNGIEFYSEIPVLNDAAIYIITVPTPYIKETKKIDTTFLLAAVRDVIENAKEKSIIIVESTVSPGTIDNVIRPIINKSSKELEIVHAPERILPGAMIDELINNSRTIGADNHHVGNIVKDMYKTFCKGEITITDIATAEMSKVVENTFRDINIAFANELAQISHKANLDVYEVIRIANKHPRVNILNPGPGVGGHCISVDPWFLVGDYPEETKLIKMARDVNDSMPRYIYTRFEKILVENNISDLSKVGIYGLSYKENVDDIRESPTLQLLNLYEDKLKNVEVYDPYIKTRVVENQIFEFDEFLNNKELLIILVAHNHLLDNEEKLSNFIVFDTKKALKKAKRIYSL